MTFGFRPSARAPNDDARLRRLIDSLVSGTGASRLRTELEEDQYVNIKAAEDAAGALFTVDNNSETTIAYVGLDANAGGVFVIYDENGIPVFTTGASGTMTGYRVEEKGTNYTLSLTINKFIACTAGGITITLLDSVWGAEDLKAGDWICVYDQDGNANPLPIEIAPAGGTWSINGSTSDSIYRRCS